MARTFAGVLEKLKAGAASISREVPRMLAFVADLEDAATLKECKAQASAITEYLAQKRDGTVDEYNAALKVKARVEHRLGEVLSSSVKRGGKSNGRDVISSRGGSSSPIPDGIEPKQSSRAQMLASVPWEKIEDRIDASTERNERASIGRIVKEHRQEKIREAGMNQATTCDEGDLMSGLSALAQAGKSFGCIYADPAWKYQNQGTRASTDNHYGTMTVEEICALPVEKVASKQSHLWLWTTNGFLVEALTKVMPAWGFEFKATYIWVKGQIGIGNYLRNAHEILLLGVRGGLVSVSEEKNVRSWGEFDRTAHSAKPEPIRRDVVEKVSPGPYLELFARNIVEGWHVLGNQIDRGLYGRNVPGVRDAG